MSQSHPDSGNLEPVPDPPGAKGIMYHFWMWALILGLVLLNAFFVAAEFALVKASVSKLVTQARRGSMTAGVAVAMTERLDAYLSATQLGITLASLGLGWVGEPYLASLIVPLLHRLHIGRIEMLSHAISFGVALAIITALHLVWGELAPKNLAISLPEKTSRVISLPLRLFYVTFYPFITALNGLANLTLRAVGIRPVSELEMSLSQEELRLVFANAYSSGNLSAQERAMMENALQFAHMRARQVMLPRTGIFYVSVQDDLKQVVEAILKSGHTRIPVVREDLDQVLGYIHVKDIASLLTEPQPWNRCVEDFLRPVHFVSEHIALSKLLVYFQREQTHMAILVDEYGGTAGMVTLENVLEQLVGTIRDEFDIEQPPIRRLGRDRFRIDGRTPLALIASRCKVEFPPTEADTIGGFLTERQGSIPQRGQRIDLGRFHVLVKAADERRVITVELVLDGAGEQSNLI